jgi:hypothetical protein
LNDNSGQQPIFATKYLGFWITVFQDRVDFKASTGSQSIPIEQIASVQIAMLGVQQITLETTGGQKYSIPTKQKAEVKEAIYKARSSFSQASKGFDTKPTISIADELLKLVQLKNQGILTEAEFASQKEKLLARQ